MTVPEQDREEIAAIIEHYRRGFATMDVEELKEIWDEDYDHIIYIAQEMAQPVRGWAGVERYYQRVAQILGPGNTMAVSEEATDVLGDVASVFCTFHFEGEASGKSHIADGRVTFLLHRKSGTWKVIHYHESRPGNLPS
ncbi:MAG: YybH family protein [Thermomicrobiales bacterium]